MILDWKKFVLRSDIKNLPLEEQRRKFLKEQLYYDNLLAEQRQRQYEFYMSQVAGGGPLATGGFSGQAVDGPISGATVISNVGVTTTNALGEFTFKRKPTGPIIVKGGTDSITGVAFEGELIGYPEYKTISPITTVAHYLKEEGNITIDEAVTKVFVSSSALFGIELPVESKDIVLQQDYIKESVVNNNRVGIAAQAVTTYLEGITETLGESLVQATAGKTTQFDGGKGKNKSYRAIGRQIALDNKLDPTTLTERVKYTEKDKFGNNVEKEGAIISNYSTISSQLDKFKLSLRTKVDEQQYTANYLTTQIQAFNLAQKTTIKSEISDAISSAILFSNIEEVKSNVEGNLKQIEAGKSNETEAVVDAKLTGYSAKNGAFSQKDSKGTAVTFQAGVFGDNLDATTVVYFGSSLRGSTLYKQVGTKLGVSYQPIYMRVDEKGVGPTTTTITANEYINIKVVDQSKNIFLITAKPQPSLEKPTIATLTAVSIEKQETNEEPVGSDTNHIVTEKTGQYTIAELVDGKYGAETSDGIIRGNTDRTSGLPILDIQYSSFYFRITENYSTLAGGAGYVGKEIFTITDIAKEGALGELVNDATFIPDEGSKTERLTFSFLDAKKVTRTIRITYNVL